MSNPIAMNAACPKVSLIMANYNHGHYLIESARSILEQDYPNFELIVVDDGSTDNSLEILTKLAKEFSNLVIIPHVENKGVVAAINTGLSASSGAYVSFQSADDYVLPGFVSKLMALYLSYPKAGVFTSRPLTLHSDKLHNHNIGYNITEYVHPEKLQSRLMWKYFWLAGHASIINKEYLMEAGGFKPSLKWYCDWFALYVIAFRYGVCYCPEGLAVLRIIETSYSQNIKKPEGYKVCCNILKLLDSEYSDVKSCFQQSAILSIFPGIFFAVMSAPRYYGFLTFNFLLRTTYYQSLQWGRMVLGKVKSLTNVVRTDASCINV